MFTSHVYDLNIVAELEGMMLELQARLVKTSDCASVLTRDHGISTSVSAAPLDVFNETWE